jgi:hypothetical protein
MDQVSSIFWMVLVTLDKFKIRDFLNNYKTPIPSDRGFPYITEQLLIQSTMRIILIIVFVFAQLKYF